jgi:hypothetical protein
MPIHNANNRHDSARQKLSQSYPLSHLLAKSLKHRSGTLRYHLLCARISRCVG